MKRTKTRKPKAANWKPLLFLIVVVVVINATAVKSEVFCRMPFLRVVGSCSCWLTGQLAEGVARSELARQAATVGASVALAGSSSMRRYIRSIHS